MERGTHPVGQPARQPGRGDFGTYQRKLGGKSFVLHCYIVIRYIRSMENDEVRHLGVIFYFGLFLRLDRASRPIFIRLFIQGRSVSAGFVCARINQGGCYKLESS